MNEIHHSQARDWLHLGSESLDAAQRAALTQHLTACAECQGLAADLTTIRSEAAQLMRARWLSRRAAPDLVRRVSHRLERQAAQQRVLNRATTLAVVGTLLALVIIAAKVLPAGTSQRSTSSLPSLPAAAPPPTLRSAPAGAVNPIGLVGAEGAADRLWPGSTFTLTLHWQTNGPVSAPYTAYVHVIDDQGDLVAQSDGVPGGRSTTDWAVGETIDDVHVLRLPDDAQPGVYQVVAGLYDAPTGKRVRLADGREVVPLMQIRLQAMQQSINQDFGGFATLLGADGLPDSIAAGEAIHLALYWRARTSTATSYRVMLQVVDDHKGLITAVDGVPVNGARPTTGWQPDELIADAYTVNLPVDMKPGQYRLLVLMFDSITGTQVFTSDDNGAITLKVFEVTANDGAALPHPIDLSVCPVTLPNGNTPPDEQPAPEFHGNGELWTVLWPDGTIVMGPQNVEPDGSLSMKFVWRRGVSGPLTIEGHRLDAAAAPLRADIPDGYGDIGIQATALIFPTEGCWEVTGRVGDAVLSFVTRVIRDAASIEQPAWLGTPAPIAAPMGDQLLNAGIANGDIVISNDGGLLWFIWENTRSRIWFPPTNSAEYFATFQTGADATRRLFGKTEADPSGTIMLLTAKDGQQLKQVYWVDTRNKIKYPITHRVVSENDLMQIPTASGMQYYPVYQ